MRTKTACILSETDFTPLVDDGKSLRGKFMIDFLKDLLKIGLGALFTIAMFFFVGTAGAAIFCWYYGIPMIFSVLGGILVLGIALALMSDSIFD